MASAAIQAQSLLVTAGIGVTGGTAGNWPIFVGRLMAEPHAQIAVYDAPGQNPNPKWLLEFPSIQVLIRGNPGEYAEAYTKGKACKDLLLGRDPTTFADGDRWDGVTGLGDLNFLRYDDNSRPLFTVNFRIIREPASNATTQRTSL